ncbi:MAG: M20/M25/M40 family metallo-hydrolase [Candidatus Shapirobacteria bacterium]|jgi:tripeptide aminopeptidase
MKNIVETFIELVKIPSPSGNEKLVREFISKKLLNTNWKVTTDVKGNLIAYKNQKAKLWLVAHMDTVQLPGQVVKPIFKGDTITSDGSTILGADNKAGVAILLYLASNGSSLDKCGLVFTVNEESGEMGSSKIDWGNMSPELILNFDGSEKVGLVNDSGMGQIVFDVEIWGKSAHASKNPEMGINAIKVASEIIHQLHLGKDDNENTCNIGRIEGGGETNVVPDYVKFVGEIRSFSKIGLNTKWENLKKITEQSAKKYGAKCLVNNRANDGVPVWEKNSNNTYKNILINAGEQIGLNLEFVKMGACSDASFLSKKAEVFSINHGGHLAHSHQEWIDIAEIHNSKLFIESIVATFNKFFKI